MSMGVTVRCNREHGSLEGGDIVVLNNVVHCRKCLEGFLEDKQQELKKYVSFTKGIDTEKDKRNGQI